MNSHIVKAPTVDRLTRCVRQRVQDALVFQYFCRVPQYSTGGMLANVRRTMLGAFRLMAKSK
jgi:hypothetical protein